VCRNLSLAEGSCQGGKDFEGRRELKVAGKYDK